MLCRPTRDSDRPLWTWGFQSKGNSIQVLSGKGALKAGGLQGEATWSTDYVAQTRSILRLIYIYKQNYENCAKPIAIFAVHQGYFTIYQGISSNKQWYCWLLRKSWDFLNHRYSSARLCTPKCVKLLKCEQNNIDLITDIILHAF